MLRRLHLGIYLVLSGLAFMWGFGAALGGFAIGFAVSSRPMIESVIAMSILAFMAITTPPIFIGMEKWGRRFNFPPYN